jgi:hypothetical protein
LFIFGNSKVEEQNVKTINPEELQKMINNIEIQT